MQSKLQGKFIVFFIKFNPTFLHIKLTTHIILQNTNLDIEQQLNAIGTIWYKKRKY